MSSFPTRRNIGKIQFSTDKTFQNFFDPRHKLLDSWILQENKQILEKFLKANLRPIEHQRRFARRYVFGPIHLGVIIAAGVFMAAGIMNRQFSLLPLRYEVGLLVIRFSYYLVVLYLVFTPAIRIGAVKRIPFVWVLFILWAFFSLFDTLAFIRIFEAYGRGTIYKAYINRIVAAAPSILVLAAIYNKGAAKALFENSELYPAWRRYQEPKELLVLKLKADIQAPIRYVEAQSPYVNVVTKKGNELLRTPFKDALELLPKDAGWQLHRSIWVAKEEVRSVFYENGNPRVLLTDGTSLGANRTMASKIRNYQALHNDENPTDESAVIR